MPAGAAKSTGWRRRIRRGGADGDLDRGIGGRLLRRGRRLGNRPALALAVRNTARRPALAAAGAGLLLGWGIFLNYGLALMGLPALAVLFCAVDRRTALRRLAVAVAAALSWW